MQQTPKSHNSWRTHVSIITIQIYEILDGAKKKTTASGECWDGKGRYRPAQDLMVWILRRRTRTLAKWVMSPANLKIFIFLIWIGSATGRPGSLCLPCNNNRFQATKGVCGRCIQAEKQTSEHAPGESHFYSRFFSFFFSLAFSLLLFSFPSLFF